MANEYGKLLKAAREGANYGVREAAKELNVSPSYLSKVETGAADPMTTLRTIDAAHLYDVEPYPLVAAAVDARNEARLPLEGETRQRRELAALLELLWVQRTLSNDQAEVIMQALKNEIAW